LKTMKKLVLLITLLASCFAQAELLIYKGTEKEINTEGNNGRPVSWKVIVIIDHETGNFSRIRYATINSAKIHRTLNETNSHIVQITGSDGKTYSAITRIP